MDKAIVYSGLLTLGTGAFFTYNWIKLWNGLGNVENTLDEVYKSKNIKPLNPDQTTSSE